MQDGILVVARDEREVSVLKELQKRAAANGAKAEWVDEKGIKTIEPHAAGLAALLAPEAASFDPKSYVAALAEDAKASGSLVSLDEEVLGLEESGARVSVRTPSRTLETALFLNAGGLHADRLARMLGVGKGYRVIPFRGDYYELVPGRRELTRTHIYPAPDPQFPFLGPHFSRTFDGRVIVGPGAAIALGRETYERVDLHAGDFMSMVGDAAFWKMLLSPRFLQLSRREWKKALFKDALAEDGRRLVPELRNEDLVYSHAGIRAQVVDDEGRLVDDLLTDETPRSFHVLNAVSPALTCSLPFADRIAETVLKKV